MVFLSIQNVMLLMITYFCLFTSKYKQKIILPAKLSFMHELCSIIEETTNANGVRNLEMMTDDVFQRFIAHMGPDALSGISM